MRRRIYVPADYAKPTLLQRLTPVILGLLVFIAFYALVILVMVEWFTGCGQVDYYADRTWETIDCVFLPTEKRTGTW